MSSTDSDNKAIQERKPKMNGTRKTALTVLISAFLIIGALWLLHWLFLGRFDIYTDDAYVNGNLVQIMPQVSGTIVSVNTDDTHLVLEGQSLVKLDDADKKITLQHARANLAAVVRQVRQYYEDVQQAQAVFVLRNADLEKAKLDYQRRAGLVNARAISKEEMQHYKTALEAAQAQYDYALHKFSSAIALVENSNLYEHPLVNAAKENFKNAYLNWIRTTIYSPVTGYVAKRSAQVGQQINPGTALLVVVPLNNVWIEANYKENQLDRIRIGQSVEVIADANGETYHGKVIGLGAGTGSAFALLPPQNATGNWIKIVQRLPVRIALDPKEVMRYPLQIGLSTRVTIYTRGLKGDSLAKAAEQQPMYVTTVYNNQLAHVEQEIKAILQANAPDIALKGMPLGQGQTHG